MKLSDEYTNKLESAIRHFDNESNEATRTHKLIARLLNEIEDISDYEYHYTAQMTNQDGKRPDFIVSHKEREFFVIEAKASLAIANHKQQILEYLKTHNLEYGSLTDGVSWTMLKFDKKSETLKTEVNLIINQPQLIVDYIVYKI